MRKLYSGLRCKGAGRSGTLALAFCSNVPAARVAIESFDVFPKTMVEMIYLEADKREFSFPDHALYQSAYPDALHPPRNIPAVYRILLHRDETDSAVYLHPAPTTIRLDRLRRFPIADIPSYTRVLGQPLAALARDDNGSVDRRPHP